VNVANTLAGSSRPLYGKQAQLWTQAVQDVGLDLDPYICKASYVCGMLRQFIEAAGIQLAHQYHVGALVSAASAAELLGWCYKGETSTDRSGNRLSDGVRYLEVTGPPYPGLVHQPAANLASWVRNIRNFGAHGAAHGKQLTLDRLLTVWLLRSLAQALDTFWADGGDGSRHERFTRAAITPLYSEGEPIFVRKMQDHLAQGLMPGAELDHEASWRPQQPWEDQLRVGVVRAIPVDPSGPAVTGTPDVSVRHHPE
jgi:hypothetical protein